MDDNKTTLPPIWQKSMQKIIHLDVCRNGDENFRKKIVLNKKRQPTFDSWLRDMSTTMKLQSGSVWRVFTPTHGHRIEDYEQLENGNLIVLAGQERFKPLRYGEINADRKKSPPRHAEQFEPNKRYQLTSGKYKKIDTQATVIRCWANGRGKDGSRVIVLPAYRNRPDSVKDVINLVSTVMGAQCGGAICNLYETSGARVRSMEQIRQNGCYVALRRKEMFAIDNYQENPLPGLKFSPRLEKKRLPPILHSNKTSSHSSPENSTASHNGYRRERERSRRQPEDQVLTRPTKHRRSSEKIPQVDYDQDHGGVFKARNQNRATRGAHEVEESRHTHTELPIDEREAVPVQDEELDYSPHTQRREEKPSREGRERKVKKEEPTSHASPQEKERIYRTNARRADSPNNEEVRREREEREREAHTKRQAEDQARKERQQQQQEALKRKKKEKEEQEKRKREEEEKRKREEEEKMKREEEEKKRKVAEKDVERERQQQQQQQQQQRKKEDEEKKEKERKDGKKSKEEKKKAEARTPTPEQYENTNNSPAPTSKDDRPGTGTLNKQQDSRTQQEEWAATKIQAGYRGYRDRQAVKRIKATKEEEEEEKRRRRIEDEAEEKRREEEERAATKIQAGFRGYRDRQAVKQLREEERRGRNSASNDKDPSPVGRDEDDEQAEQERAATKIQAGFRGAKARQQVKAMRQEEEVKAATSPDPHPTTKDPSLRRAMNPEPTNTQTPSSNSDNVFQHAEHTAATTIQAAFRSHQIRKGLAQEHHPNPQGGQGHSSQAGWVGGWTKQFFGEGRT